MKAAAAASSSVFSVHQNAAQETLAGSSPVTVRDCAPPAAVRLTARQLEVLALLCEGLPNKLICRELSISAGTVKAHISGILRELGVNSRLQAVVAARRAGLISPEARDSVRPRSHADEEIGGRAAGGMVTLVDSGQRAGHRFSSSPSGR